MAQTPCVNAVLQVAEVACPVVASKGALSVRDETVIAVEVGSRAGRDPARPGAASSISRQVKCPVRLWYGLEGAVGGAVMDGQGIQHRRSRGAAVAALGALPSEHSRRLRGHSARVDVSGRRRQQ